MIGPWDHSATRVPRKQIGGLTFGDASLVDIDDLNRAWYDWVFKGAQRPTFLRDRVAYYLTGAGAERWKYTPTWKRPRPRPDALVPGRGWTRYRPVRLGTT